MSYTAILLLKPRPGEAWGTWKPSRAFESPSEREAVKAAFDWKDKNTAEGYKAKELWLSEGSCKTMLWQAEDVERTPTEES